MVIDEAGALHKGIASDGAEEAETTFFKIRAYFIPFLGAGRNLRECAPLILPWLPAHHVPKIFGETAKFFLHREEIFRV